jgi:hypothetical protein
MKKKRFYLLNFWKHYNIKKSWQNTWVHFEMQRDDLQDKYYSHIGVGIEILGIRLFGIFFDTYMPSFSIQLLNFSANANFDKVKDD